MTTTDLHGKEREKICGKEREREREGQERDSGESSSRDT